MRNQVVGTFSHQSYATRVVQLFVLWSAAWVMTSDYILKLLTPDEHTYWMVQTEKGLAYVVISAALIWYAVRRLEKLEQRRRTATEQRLRLLKETGLIGIASISPDGRFAYANHAVSEMLGYSLEEIRRMREGELIAPECEEVRALAEREFAEHGRTGLYKCSLVRKDGSRIPVIGGRALVTETGETIKYFIDISPLVDMEEERSKLQQQLLQSEKVNSLGQFASGVAHNFNNELSIIMGYGSVLEEQFGSDANSRRILQQMMKAAERSRNLIQQLLAFSRRQTTHPEIIDLNHAVSELKSTVRQVTRDSIDISVELSGEPEHIHADPALLEQALFNLAKNAGEAMPFGGTLTFSVAHEQLLDEGARISECAIVRVTDSGHGMEEETQKKIFEPFFTTKQQSGGTGLGLSTVYGFTKQSGGDIQVDSQPGKGTTFTLRFPKIRISATPRVGAEKGEAVPQMNATVLLVEDNSELRQMMAEILSASGLTVIQAKDGFEALNRAKSAKFDLVLTDVLMPGMNGPEVVDRIREAHPTVKVIFISGSADMVRANSEDLVMWKPVRPETLLRAVYTSLSNKASADPRSRPAA